MVHTRRTFLATALAAPSQTTRRPPNVVLVMTDDQGYGDLSCHGNPVLKTPEIDRLHGDSIRLTNYHVSPTCAPTRSALLTGRYTNSTGAWHTIMGRSLLRPGEVTLAECFRASGYQTGIFGKWHLGDNYPCRPQDRGFDEVVVHGGGGVWQTPDYFGNDYTDDTYFHNGRPEKYRGFCTDVWFDNAMRFMGGARRPFFCYIPTNAPHGPMWSRPQDAKPYEGVKGLREPGFFGMIANIDENMGRLRKFLTDRGLAENTLLIFTTDNGTSSGHQVFNAGMRGNKGSAYEGGHRVPFFLHWPAGGFTGGRDVTPLTAHIDVTPTLIDVCSLKRPSGPPMNGRSLTPLLADPKAEWTDREIVVDSQRVENLVKWRQAAVMTEQWRLVNPSPDGNPARLELYDMSADPAQKTNVAAANPAIVDRLSKAYDRWWTEVSKAGNDPVRIVLGSDAENPSRLTAHDWHGDGSEKVWNQRGIREAPSANGYWAVQFARPGRYRFELRRWPKELDLPLGAPFSDTGANREEAKGAAVTVRQARIKVGSAKHELEVKDSQRSVVFTITVAAGPADIETALVDAAGVERGAYFLYVTRL